MGTQQMFTVPLVLRPTSPSSLNSLTDVLPAEVIKIGVGKKRKAITVKDVGDGRKTRRILTRRMSLENSSLILSHGTDNEIHNGKETVAGVTVSAMEDPGVDFAIRELTQFEEETTGVNMEEDLSVGETVKTPTLDVKAPVNV